MIITMVATILISLPDKALRFLNKQLKRYMQREYFGPGTETTVDQELGDEMKDIQLRSTTILRAARLFRMKEDIDYVTPEQELRLMAETSSKAHWMPKDHHPAAMNNMLRAVQHEITNSAFEFDEVADPRGASELMHHALAGSQSLIVRKLLRSRRRAEEVKRKLSTIPTDSEKDNYLMKRFLCDSLPGYRRLVAQHYFFDGAEVEENFRNQPLWFIKLSSVLMFSWYAGGIAFLIYFGLNMGTKVTELWLLSLISCILQDVFAVQPMRAFVKYIIILESVREELLALYECLSFRARTLIQRKRGMMRNKNALVQHFNPACRVARVNPTLPTSRILISLTDFDLPVSHRLPPFIPPRAYRDAIIAGQGATSQASTFISQGASPLFTDVYELFVLNTYFFIRSMYDMFWRFLFWLMSVGLNRLMKLNDACQNAIIESVCAVAFNMWLLSYLYVQHQSDVFCFVYVVFSIIAISYFLYSVEMRKRKEKKDKKDRIAMRDAIRARRYFKQYLKEGTFDPGAAREQGVYYKERGLHAKTTFQPGTERDYENNEERKSATDVFHRTGLLPFTGTIATSEEVEEKEHLSGLWSRKDSVSNNDRKRETRKKKISGKRDPYSTTSNVNAYKTAGKVVPVSEAVMIENDTKDLNKDSGELGSGVMQEIKLDGEEEFPDEESSARGVLSSLRTNVDSLIGGILPISWGTLKGKPVKDGLASDSNSTTTFVPLDGPPTHTRAKKKAREGSSSIERSRKRQTDVERIDAAHSMTKSNLSGSQKASMSLTLANAASGAFDPSRLEDGLSGSQGMVGEGGFSTSQVLGGHGSINLLGESIAEGHEDASSYDGTYDGTVNSIDPYSLKTGDPMRDKIKAKIKRSKNAKRKEVDAVADVDDEESVGPGRVAAEYTKPDRKREKQRRKREENKKRGIAVPLEDEDETAGNMILPLKDALFELASLKVLGDTNANGQTFGTDAAGQDSNLDKAAKIALKKKRREKKQQQQAAGGGGADEDDDEDDDISDHPDAPRGAPANFDIMGKKGQEAPRGAQGAAEGEVIRENGRTVKYRTMKDNKDRVIKAFNKASMKDVRTDIPAPTPYVDLNSLEVNQDIEHAVHHSGVAFLPPHNNPDPIRPVGPARPKTLNPADTIKDEQLAEPKYALYL